MKSNFDNFRNLLSSPFTFRLFLIKNLPLAFFVGLKVVEFSHQQTSVTVRKKWFNNNPFQSIYFAVLSMAAELSTGLISSAGIYKRKPVVSMLIVKMDGSFYKKATGTIVFSCKDVEKILEAIEQSLQTTEGTTVVCNSKGVNEAGEIVAEFNFTWSFKARRQRI